MGPASSQPRSALVIVLGDLGRSPRMTQHALALAERGSTVALAGYLETPLDERLARHSQITVHELKVEPAAPPDASPVAFAWRTFRRVASLHRKLGRILWRETPPGGVVLAQNPPSLPTLWLGALLSRRRGARFVVDWHNFGFAMLALRFPRRGLLVRLAERYERWAGRRADGAFCVSRAMQQELTARRLDPPPVVVYDRPMALEPPLDPVSRRELLRKLLPDAPPYDALLVCPTSWTLDEDIGLLLDALVRRERLLQTPPRLLVLLTGEGPLRLAFERRLTSLRLERAVVQRRFFDPADYRCILRAADLGLSLHRSASGVDLPMKIADFFGARTPVLALDYGPCLAEQLADGVNGRTFRDADELAELLNSAVEEREVERLRAGLRGPQKLWPEEVAAGWRALSRRWNDG